MNIAGKKSLNFTKTSLVALEPEEKRYYRYDEKVPQLGLFIHPSGTKSYFVRATINGKTQRIGIPHGKFPAMTPEVARKKAGEIIARANDDINVVAEKKQEKVAAQEEEVRKKEQEVTLREMVVMYITQKELKEDTARQYYQKIRHEFLDNWDLPMDLITEDMVTNINGKRGKPAAPAMRYLKAVFNFARAIPKHKKAGLFQENPVNTLNEQKLVKKYGRRKSYIKREDLMAWMDAVDNQPAMIREYYLFLLLTGVRSDSEAGALTWDRINWRSNTFLLTDTKNKSDIELPLPSSLIPALKQRKEKKGLVFPIINSARLQRDEIVEQSEVTFIRHDLRRTFLTIGESLDISYLTIKRLANHADGDDVTAGYVVTNLDRLTKASKKIETYVLTITGRLNAEVTQLHG